MPSLTSPYGEAGAGTVLSENGGPCDPAYTPPADEARKTATSESLPDASARSSKKERNWASSWAKASAGVATTPAPEHQTTLNASCRRASSTAAFSAARACSGSAHGTLARLVGNP